jgi:hypothetical protein
MSRAVLVALALVAAGGGPARAGSAWPPAGALAAPTSAESQSLRITVDHPAAGARFADERPALVSGHALPPGVAGPRRDVVVVIDVSESTLSPVQTPPEEGGNGDAPPASYAPLGEPGAGAPPGSILEAEILAVRTLLRSLDPRLTRVAILTFSGEPGAWGVLPPHIEGLHPDSRTWTGLTDDWPAVERALDRVQAAGAHGLTNIAAGVQRATSELVGGPEAVGTPDPNAQRVVLFMTDGVPTLPVPGDAWRNQAELFKEARRAAGYGIRIHSFAVGNEALRGPFTVETLASETGGSFTPVRDPATLPDRVPLVPLTGLERLTVRNLTTGQAALATNLRPDGTFDALVRLDAGTNRIEIEATASDGARAQHALLLERDAAAAAAAAAGEEAGAATLPPHLVHRRRELLEKGVEERREARRQELLEEMDRERARWREEAERQRRELELELDRTPGAVGAPGAGRP